MGVGVGPFGVGVGVGPFGVGDGDGLGPAEAVELLPTEAHPAPMRQSAKTKDVKKR